MKLVALYTPSGSSRLTRVGFNSIRLLIITDTPPATFSADIDYLLVIAGSEKVDIIGIGYNPSTSGIDVVYTGISVATPSKTTFSQIVGTPVRSRIFLLGNGCIHELMYKSKGTLVSRLKMEGRHVKNWTAALEYWRHLVPVYSFKYEST